ncbi:MAG: hypothetical protein ACIAXF_17140 [Phycisphaerales bacterium JB063]
MAWRVGGLMRAALLLVFAGGAVAAHAQPMCFAMAQLPRDADWVAGPPRVVLLGVVPLPAEPTPAEVAAHLEQIAEATQALPHAPRPDDPQVELLEALAGDYLDELVQAHEMYPVLRYYLDPIIHREIALRGGPDVERLQTVTLREGADEQAAWSYVMDIARATAGQRRVTANDPQVAMLSALSREHMRVLVDAIALEDLRFYALLAVRQTADESHKETLINALPDQPRLIVVVRQQGWAEDARDTLIAGLARGVDYMPRTWVQTMVELEDPATYDALATHLARSRGARTYYNLMQALPGIELGPAVGVAWERVNDSPRDARELREVSELAVQYGHAEALAHLVSLLPEVDSPATSYEASVRAVVLGHIEFAGTNAQIKAWHAANRDRLVFSAQGGVFYAAGMLQ